MVSLDRRPISQFEKNFQTVIQDLPPRFLASWRGLATCVPASADSLRPPVHLAGEEPVPFVSVSKRPWHRRAVLHWVLLCARHRATTSSLWSPFYGWRNRRSPYSPFRPADHGCVTAWLPLPTRWYVKSLASTQAQTHFHRCLFLSRFKIFAPVKLTRFPSAGQPCALALCLFRPLHVPFTPRFQSRAIDLWTRAPVAPLSGLTLILE